MPTGYTAKLYDALIPFSEFAWDCARAFGALAELRDAPDAEIPEAFKPSPYYYECLAEAKQRLAEVTSWTDEQSAEAARIAYSNEVKSVADYNARKADIQERYELMLATVRAWVPPTPDHIELRHFMIEQLESSIQFDCGFTRDEPVLQDGRVYWAEMLDCAIHDVKHYTEQVAEEEKRAADRTQWVRALRNSLAC